MTSQGAYRAFAAHWLGRFGLSNALAIILVVLSLMAGGATYAAMSRHSSFLSDPASVSILIGLDLTLLGLLAAAVVWRVVVLLRARARGLAGAKLHLKLVLTFSLLAVVPSVMVAGMASVFFFAGVQTWFSDTVSSAVNESKAVADSALEAHQRTIVADVLTMANSINRSVGWIGSSDERLQKVLTDELATHNLNQALIFDSAGRVIARAGLSSLLGQDKVRDVDLERARSGDAVLMVDQDDGRARALLRLDRFVDSYLMVSRYTDSELMSHVQQAQEASSAYAAYEAHRIQLQRGVMLIFIVVALVMLLAAIFLGLNVANQLIMPISALILASDRVRGGDLTVRVEQTERSNELGTLIRSFNRMTNQLQTQRRELVETNRQLDERRRFTEAVLAGVSAGVMDMDAEGVIQLANSHVCDLLALPQSEVVGHSVLELLPELEELFIEARRKNGRVVEKQVQLKRANKPTRTLHARLAPEMEAEALLNGYVLTIDEITELVSAQRMAAWADVARRIAHEIKNPLTPIQLSAERLKRKYLSQITKDADIFSDCTDTIFRQVDDIRRMVDEFSSFARMPAAVIRPQNISALVREAVILQRQAHRDIQFITHLPAQDTEAPADARQLRQALTNLIQNAIDAISEKPVIDGATAPQGQVTVSLLSRPDSLVLEVADNGKGLPQDERDRLTEPYVTTRAKGTGLGLAIVKKIMEDHSGTLELDDNSGGGAIVRLVIPVIHAMTIGDAKSEPMTETM